MSSDITTNALVQQGDLIAYNSVASWVLSNVTAELTKYPSYSLVSIGHSLGGALASVAGVSLKSNFPDVPLRMFTYGQPRTGNPGYATMVETLIGKENLYRGRSYCFLCVFSIIIDGECSRPYKRFAIYGLRVYRLLNTIISADGVPTLVPRILGYQHQ